MDSDSDVYDGDDDMDYEMTQDDDHDTTSGSQSLDRKFKILQPKDLITDQLTAIDEIHELFQVQ